jgi:hypothetical protein
MDDWNKGGVAWGAPSSHGKFYKGPSADTPWNNDLLHKLNCEGDMKVLGMEGNEKGHVWRMGSFYEADGKTKASLQARPNYKARKLIQAQRAPKIAARKRRIALKRRNALASAQLAAKRAAARGEPPPPEAATLLHQEAERKRLRERGARIRVGVPSPGRASPPRPEQAARGARAVRRSLKAAAGRPLPSPEFGILPETRTARPRTSRLRDVGSQVTRRDRARSLTRRPATSRTARTAQSSMRTWRTCDQRVVDGIGQRVEALDAENKIDLLMAVEDRLSALEQSLMGGLNDMRQMRRQAAELGRSGPSDSRTERGRERLRAKRERRLGAMHAHVQRLQGDCARRLQRGLDHGLVS